MLAELTLGKLFMMGGMVSFGLMCTRCFS